MEKLLTIIDGPRLTSCRFVRSQIKDGSNKEILVKIKLFTKVNHNLKKNTAVISWSIKSDSVGLPFEFDVEVEGLFKVAKKVEKKEIVEAARMEAGPLLVVTLRDIISDLTRKAELTPFYLSYPDFATLRVKEIRNSSVSKKKDKKVSLH